MSRLVANLCSNTRFVAGAAILLLAIHAGLLAYAATQHSPTMLEPAFLAAGLSHWEFGRFELFRVNPPLVRMVAALPVMVVGYNQDWSRFHDSPGARPEFQLGADLVKANGQRSIWLFTIARWACLPFTLIGGVFCFLWSRELWGNNLAGLISLSLWTFDPNILAHAELITSDCAAASLGLGASYLFWRWLRFPSWSRAASAGLLLGLAELTKTSWVILFVLWPLLSLFWLLADMRKRRTDDRRAMQVSPWTFFLQSSLILFVGLYVLNLGYRFDGTFTRLKDFTFVSKTLTGLQKAGEPGNRFSDSWQGQLRVPVPRQYLSGIDLQKKDLENYPQLSYLRGQWKRGGWWYYYLYGLAVKTPHGTQLLLLIAFLTIAVQRVQSHQILPIHDVDKRDLIVLLAPALTILILVSSQLEFNHHLRYVLPVLGFLAVFSGTCSLWWRTSLPAEPT